MADKGKVKIPMQTGLSVKALKDRLNNSSGGGGGRKDFKMLMLGDGDTATVRFLDEPEKWVLFGEHFVQGKGFVPCLGEDGGCGPCEDGMNPSERGLVNVYVYEVERQERKVKGKKYDAKIEEPKRVLLLKMNNGLRASVIVRSERRKTVTDREVAITREGGGTDTEYVLDWSDSKSAAPKISSKDKIDIPAYLQEMVDAYYGDNKNSSKSKNKPKGRGRDYDEDEDLEEDTDLEDDEDFDEDEELDRLTSRRNSNKRRR